MSVARQRVLIHQHEAHPVEALAAAASEPQVRTDPSPPTLHQPQRPVSDTAGHVNDRSKRTKVPVNYRLDPEVAEKLKEGSLTYSAQQRQRISQNAIVEIAVREWLIAHDLWDLGPTQ
jgi:hypothetical protein